MNIQLFVALRYLFTKKSHHVINIISGISVFGVAIATAALVCILSVFNGFQDMIANLFTAFDPQLKVVPAKGKFMDAGSDALAQLKSDDRVAVYSEVLQDNVLLATSGRQQMAVVKGVDDEFEHLIDFPRIRYGDGPFQLHADVIDYGIFGVNLLSNLGLGSDFPSPIQVYAPRGGERIDPTDPSESFNQDELYSPHVAFYVKQNKYDANYVITSLRFARRIFEREGQVSAVELKLKPGINIDRTKDDIASTLGPDYKVLDRYEQQEDTFKIMKIEKLISYIFLTFILLIACFNIIGSLSMLIIDKKDDVVTLRNMGATEQQIAGIFTAEGRLISLIGAVVGIVLGLLLCYLQHQFGIIKFGQSAGSYIIDAYPVSVKWTDIVTIFLTVIVVGFISVWYPVRQLTRRLTTGRGMAAMTFVTALCLMSCGPEGDQFVIKGTFTDMPVGQLFIYNSTDPQSPFDTISVNNGKFSYMGQADHSTPYIIVFPNALEQVIFVDGGQEIKYKASTRDLKNYNAEPNDDNRIMNDFRRQTSELTGVQVQEVARQFINQNPQSAAAIYLFDRYFVQERTPFDETHDMLDILFKHQEDNPYLHSVNDTYKRLQGAQIGQRVPHVTVKTRGHGTLALDSLKTSNTVVVYWASWMPRVYDFIDNFNITIEEYGTDNDDLQFLCVSLDTEMYKWVNRIKEDTIMSLHACDGRAWESPVVSKMGINDIPSYVIISANHTVVARGKNLDEMEKDLSKLK